jgi:hypothetical protein
MRSIWPALCSFWPALCGIALDNDPALCRIARNQGPFWLKGQLHEIFDHRIFSSINPIRSRINKLKPFRIWLRIRRDIRRQSRQYMSRAMWHGAGPWSSAMQHSAGQTHIR